MTTDRWVQSALKNDVLVAELLLRLKHSSDLDSDSIRAPPPPATATAITTIVPPRWGHRKNRSKSTASTATVANGVYGKEHRRSPTTHLSWSGGGASTSDGYEESSRPSDLSSGSRSVKANEGGSISSHNKFEKRIKVTTLDEISRNKMRRMELSSVKAEAEGAQRGFVLPDLNMAPDDEDLMMMS